MKINGVKISVQTLAAQIHDEGAYLKRSFEKKELQDDPSDPDSFAGTDARLQVHAGSWLLRTGDSSFDQDHRGSWGCSSIPWGCTWKEAREIARELLNDCANCAVGNDLDSDTDEE